MSRILGSTVDHQTRCIHYRTELDVVAIRFRCCGEFYPCHRCHEESVDHPVVVWPASEWDAEAILCGVCDTVLPISRYLEVDGCPSCGAPFNPRCRLHKHLYFETD